LHEGLSQPFKNKKRPVSLEALNVNSNQPLEEGAGVLEEKQRRTAPGSGEKNNTGIASSGKSAEAAVIHAKAFTAKRDNEQSALEQKIDLITSDVARQYQTRLKETVKKSREGAHDVSTICEHIIVEINETNIKATTREGKIKVLLLLSRFHKPFEKMTKIDVLAYLNSLRKPISDDPTQRWISTFNGRQMILLKFFKQLTESDEPDNKKRIVPPCMAGVKQLPQKDKNSYMLDNLWDAKDHAIFLKYCPSKRDRCFRAMAADTSARPHELISPHLRIKDVKFKVSTSNGRRYASDNIHPAKVLEYLVTLFRRQINLIIAVNSDQL
jgi:hypothetical protein